MKWSGNRRALCGRAEQWPVTILDANHLIGASGLTVVSYLDELKSVWPLHEVYVPYAKYSPERLFSFTSTLARCIQQ